tara:strand:- start:245 stop:790 length:546 start_codon:yes stop_codon:yes gene_type:complete
MYCGQSAATIENCTITGNATTTTSSATLGGGMVIFFCDPIITGCSFLNNAASEGGGVYCAPLANPSFVACSITGNTATTSGGGIFIFNGSNPALENTEVCGNESDQIDGSWSDNGGNTVADDCRTDCLGDLDADGTVGPQDLALLLGAWNDTNTTADLDGDGTVGPQDLALLLGAWGLCTE